MSYLLFLMFEYRRFKRDAIIRIYADNFLVDELNLVEDIKLKVKDKTTAPKLSASATQGPDNKCRIHYLPEKLFMFEIDEKHLQKCLKIQVINDDNNYTNGFMTSFSYIIFHHVMLIPDCLLDFNNWLRINRRPVAKTGLDNSKYYPMPGFQNRHYKLTSDTNEYDTNFQYYRRGDSFSVEFDLFKKHGIMHLSKPAIGKLSVSGDPPKILYWYKLLNNYR